MTMACIIAARDAQGVQPRPIAAWRSYSNPSRMRTARSRRKTGRRSRTGSQSSEGREGRKQAAGQLEGCKPCRKPDPPCQAVPRRDRQRARRWRRRGANRPATGTGQLSLVWTCSRGLSVTSASSLQPTPRRTALSCARHERESRAGCHGSSRLPMLAAILRGLRGHGADPPPNLWLAAVAGTARLFLLPAGVCGLVLLVTALCTLVSGQASRS